MCLYEKKHEAQERGTDTRESGGQSQNEQQRKQMEDSSDVKTHS
jgi:hypothetical protein